ncbi:hypothetical protein [Chamaesiphon minutus]|uniref:Uncharacterized protein n=1 Tax=Chamaesiphon minutus (strain ATCC 27169 / PCC 6605) TaxID=1173020 RepID=K9ULE8_CHAP6|nr:hypothetical protein [Chamaesiphon minutus]AFY95922.1 hypothetical protein Cha6605_5016 [Chamaesiphon minutus PCC 6605]
MTQSIAIIEAITTIIEPERRFDLTRNEEPDVFREWQENLPQLTATDLYFIGRFTKSLYLSSIDKNITSDRTSRAMNIYRFR